MTPQKTLTLSKMQREYIRCADRRWNVKTGATRSGKTYLDIIYTIPGRLRASHGKAGLRLMLGATKGTLTRNIIEPLGEYWGDAFVSSIGADNTARLFGERVYCLGADSIRQVNRIRGASVVYCYGDEVTTWAQDVFEMLKSRLDKPDSRFDGTCNPESPQHWFKHFLDSDADIYQQAYTIDDNPFLPVKFVEDLKREYSGTVYYDRFILGKWQKAEGLVYPAFGAKNIVPTIERKYTRYVVSCDYGIQNPFSAGLWGLCGGVWYRIREYYHGGRETREQFTDEQYYSALCDFIGDAAPECIIIDPSAASFITLCRQRGQYKVRQARNDVLPGIQATAAALAGGLIAFNDCCVNAIREFELYAWDEKTGVDRVIKENDHAMDDIRYFVYTTGIARPHGTPGYNMF